VCQLRRRWGSRIRIITYDHPRSRPFDRRSDAHLPDRGDSLPTWRTFSTRCTSTGPLTLAGHSMGGMTAGLAYFGRPASKRPVEPHGLVLGPEARRAASPSAGIQPPVSDPRDGGAIRTRSPTHAAARDRIMPSKRSSGRLAPLSQQILRRRHPAAACCRPPYARRPLTTAAGFLPSPQEVQRVRRAWRRLLPRRFVVSGGADCWTPASHSAPTWPPPFPGAISSAPYHLPGHLLLQRRCRVRSAMRSARAMGMCRRIPAGSAKTRGSREKTVLPQRNSQSWLS